MVGAEEEVAYKRSDTGRSRSSERGSVNGMSRSSSRSRGISKGGVGVGVEIWGGVVVAVMVYQ